MRRTLAAFAIVLLSALPAVAQTADQSEDLQDCQVLPDSNNGNHGAAKQSGEAPNARSDDLSGSLQSCGGVLKPPPTGDQNAMTPPPTGNDMPVIKPGQVPPQTGQ